MGTKPFEPTLGPLHSPLGQLPLCDHCEYQSLSNCWAAMLRPLYLEVPVDHPGSCLSSTMSTYMKLSNHHNVASKGSQMRAYRPLYKSSRLFIHSWLVHPEIPGGLQ